MASWTRIFLSVLLPLAANGAQASANSEQGHLEPASPFISVKTTGKTMEQAVADLKRAITGHNYVFVRQQAIDKGLVTEANEDQSIVIVYFCNFGMLHASLKVDKLVGVYLPCRVTLIREADGVRMVVVDPKFVGSTLGDMELADICEQLSADYRDILVEATL